MAVNADARDYRMEGADIAWCPGCGNFAILKAVQQALADLRIPPTQAVLVSGIGQAAKLPHYLKAHVFNGLHGRALPPATAIKVANPALTVLAESGDGDMYGEGGNHFLHTIRRNPDITNIVHNNMVYGLTKGQASPTSPVGFTTPVQINGVFLEPFNPIAVAIALDASFVARAFAFDIEQTREILKQAISHPGYALVDIFQPCVTYNKVNTFQWFKDNTYYLDNSHNPLDRHQAFRRAVETEKRPLGIFYRHPGRLSFETHMNESRNDSGPLLEHRPNLEALRRRMEPQRVAQEPGAQASG